MTLPKPLPEQTQRLWDAICARYAGEHLLLRYVVLQWLDEHGAYLLGRDMHEQGLIVYEAHEDWETESPGNAAPTGPQAP
jgi:hypothetical protein